MITNYYHAEPRLGIVLVDKSNQGQTVAWTGIPEIDKNTQNSLIVGQKMGQVDSLACSGISCLQNLNIPTMENIFQTIRVRYFRDYIYTECGEQVLIVVNPHKPLLVYDEQLLVQYKLSKQNDKQPHIYKITEQAKIALFNSPLKSASIVLTGQSGAGKTVSTKHILKYIAKESKSGTYQSVKGIDVISIDEQITQTNIIFEAFGNAQTTRNKNSSRFGKLIQIQFNNQKKVQSGRIQIHLFEKIRLTKLNYQDRNFHIFYQLLAGYQNRNLLSDVEKHLNFEQQSGFDFDDFAIRLPDLHLDYKFKILGDLPVTKDDLIKFVELCEALYLLKLKQEEIYAIFDIIAAILHLGGVEKHTIATYNPYTFASKLLQISNLEELCQREELKSAGKIVETLSSHNGLIMHLYSQLLDWIVNKVNSQLSQNEQNQYSLNIFDGFGFEIIENKQGIQKNRLEQMLVNYTCEKIENYFFQSIVKYEQTPYINEGIQWKQIKFDQNDILVKLFEEVIFTSLSDCTQLGSTEQSLLDNIKKACPLRRVSTRGTDSRNITQFGELIIRDTHTQEQKKLSESKILGIKHSGGEVFYNLHQFLQRNKYAISEQRQSITQQSQNIIVNKFSVIKQSTTLVKNTRASLQQLLQLFSSSVPFFVKCILPNSHQKPRTFDGPSVLSQLSESGIQQTTQLQSELYHFKVPISEFIKNYSLIFREAKENKVVKLDLVKRLFSERQELQHIHRSNPPLLQFGKDTVFMKKAVKNFLDSLQQKLFNNIICWGVKQIKKKIQNKKTQQPIQQITQFGIIPEPQIIVEEVQHQQVQKEQHQQIEEQQHQKNEMEQQPQIVETEKQLTYQELVNKIQETEAQLAIFQKLYQQELQKNRDQQQSASLSLIEQINGKLEILFQRSASRQQGEPLVQEY